MLFDVQHDVEIAGGTTELAYFAASGETNARAIFHSGGDLGVHGALPQHASLAFALRTGICDHSARPLTRRTRAGDAEEALLIPHLPAACARLASAGPLAGRSAGTATFFAGFVAAHGDLGLGTEKCFFKFQGQVFAQIGSALHPAAAPSTAAAKGVAEAEEFPEDFADILEPGSIEATALTCAAQSRVAVTIVDGALFRVGEDGVGLAHFLEFFLGVGIVGIAVGMELQSQFAVRALEFLFGASAGHAEQFVIIAFCVRGQNRPFILQRPMPYEIYFPGFLATFTMAGRSKRSLNL